MKKFYFTVLGLIFFLFISPVFAQDIYMQAGTITTGAGASDDAAYKDYTYLTSMQFGATNPGSTQSGGGGGTGKTTFADIVITKTVNISSTKILLALAKGSHIAKVTIVSTGRDKDGNRIVAHKMEFQDVRFTDASFSGVEGCPGNCPGIAESFKFTYTKVKITTYGANEMGDWVPTGVFDWDVAQNRSN